MQCYIAQHLLKLVIIGTVHFTVVTLLLLTQYIKKLLPVSIEIVHCPAQF